MLHDSRPDALRVHLHPKQWVAFLTEATEVLFGGAAGPGKSHLMRIAAILWCSAIPGLQVYLFRRIREDLYKNHVEGPKGFRNLLSIWIFSGWCRFAGDEIRFWNGSVIYLCHCKAESDIYKYQGAEIHVLLIDELTHFTEAMYRYLRGRVRMVGLRSKLPPEYVGKFPRVLCGSNPGGKGHLWVKTTFISDCVPMQQRRMPKEEGGMLRQFIPGRLEDNPSMTEDDPDYEAKLHGLGSATLVAAMRYGDWDVVEGAFFSEWSNVQHVIPPFKCPEHWTRFRSADWGSNSPYSVGWWAVVGDDFRLPMGIGEPSILLPRGALVRYREDYGKVGAKLTSEALGKRIAKFEENDPKLSFGVLDPSAFAVNGGPPIAEGINDELIKKGLISFHMADNKRASQSGSVDRSGPISGWDQVRGRLVGTARKRPDFSVDWSTGRPMIYFFSTCIDSIRTIPVLQHDPNKAEDLDTKSEDHAADDVRYACMSRPWIKTLPKDDVIKRDAFREARDDSYQDSTATL